jgi:hypothetical protein
MKTSAKANRSGDDDSADDQNPHFDSPRLSRRCSVGLSRGGMVTFASQRKPKKVEPGHAEPNRADSTCSQIDWGEARYVSENRGPIAKPNHPKPRTYLTQG